MAVRRLVEPLEPRLCLSAAPLTPELPHDARPGAQREVVGTDAGGYVMVVTLPNGRIIINDVRRPNSN